MRAERLAVLKRILGTSHGGDPNRPAAHGCSPAIPSMLSTLIGLPARTSWRKDGGISIFRATHRRDLKSPSATTLLGDPGLVCSVVLSHYTSQKFGVTDELGKDISNRPEFQTPCTTGTTGWLPLVWPAGG
jgi:hypothetical protein